MDAPAIRQARDSNPRMRERDFARIHGIAEAQLIAAYAGQGTTVLRPEMAEILKALPALGEVMALTRNESAVHETIGTYGNVEVGGEAGIVHGEVIDLRVFPRKWAHAFAVEKHDAEGSTRRSLQFFDATGEAMHKVHLRERSDLGAYDALVERFTAGEQSAELTPVAPAVAGLVGAPAGVEELRDSWRALTDTHQFYGMLRRLNLGRLEALSMIDEDLAWPLDPLGASRLLFDAASGGVPIMAFVNNPGCIQIYSGPVTKVESMGPWVNVFDDAFHLHLRQDQIDELWAVRKPTGRGHVTSVEAYAADKSLIIQFFGVRQEGTDERREWRALAENLGRLNRSSAA